LNNFIALSFSGTVSTSLTRPRYRNQELEQIIKYQEGNAELQIIGQNLTAEDMEIVIYRGLQKNTVRK
jgi:hypothetical protein